MKQLLAILLFVLPLWALSQTSPIEFNKHIIEQNSSLFGGWTATLDLDKDGDTDFVASSPSENLIEWYENDGAQNFTKKLLKDQLSGVNSFGAVDINLDGHTDFWVQVQNTNEFVFLVNDGLQNFTKVNVPELTDLFYGFALVYDYDGDGDLDIENNDFTTNELKWLENDGNLNFTKRTITSLNLTDYFIKFTADFNNDGKVDFLVQHKTTGVTGWFENIDGINFNLQNSSFSFDGFYLYIYSESKYDLNKDGYRDLIGYSSAANEFVWFENDGNQNFTKHIISTNVAFPSDPAIVEDVDQDQDVDIVVSNYSPNELIWFENIGNQNFNKHIIASNTEGNPLHFSVSDVDSDNDADLFMAGYNTKAILWFENYLTSENIGEFVYQAPTLGNYNYVYTTVPQIPVTTIDNSTIKTNSDVIESVGYFDGLGRPMQQVAIRAGGKGEDLIKPISYDAIGRQEKDYLPFATASNTVEKYHVAVENDINSYYKTKYENDFSTTLEGDINPYSEKHFEASPLNRVLEQAAPGDSWKIDKDNDTDHTIKFEYQTNDTLSVRLFDVIFLDSLNTEAPSLIETGFYNPKELNKTVTKDENWQPGQTHANDHTTEEFKDKQGMVVLKRTYNDNQQHDTYYVYDDYNNLTYVLPPKMEGATATIAAINTTLPALGYQYKYDYRNRLIEKKIPGKGLESIVYDNLDRPVLTQDANLAADDEWLFTKYDAFGRVVYTGKFSTSDDRPTLQTTFTNKNTQESNYEEKGSSTLAIDYTNADFPNTGLEILTVNYYDDYNFVNPATNPTTVFEAQTTAATRSLATGSKVKVLETTNDWITTVTYYDAKARPIYVYSQNDFLNTIDIIKSQLDFTGRVLKTRTSHIKNSEPEIVTLDTFTYDQAGRVLKQVQCIGGSDLDNDCGVYGAEGIEDTLVTSETVNPGTTKTIEASDAIILTPGFVAKPVVGQIVEVKVNTQAATITGSQIELIAENSYDGLGQLVQKKVGNIESAALQDVSYNYNVRGWLKNINDINSIGKLFNLSISYDSGASPLFNGNISQTQWQTNNTDSSLKTYDYTYDALNRITDAVDNTGGLRYTLNDVRYDKNGNITALDRRGHINVEASSFGVMDAIRYTYYANSNKLRWVIDHGNDDYGFKDGNQSGTDYTYDNNGNMKIDANKGITNINYNHLNLPTQVTINNQNIDYIYDATGVKLQKEVNGTTTEYAGNYIYEKPQSGSSILQFFNHPEGYVTPNNSNGFDYVYQYKDHLGNVRLSYTNIDSVGVNLEIIEENNYYPFGLKHKGYNTGVGAGGNSVAQRYKFGGKELQDEVVGGGSLEWYDITARNYDPALGRWMNLDPLAESMRRHSPYNYAFDNPIYYVDPDGMMPFGFDDNDLDNKDNFRIDDYPQRQTSTVVNDRGEIIDYKDDGDDNIYLNVRGGLVVGKEREGVTYSVGNKVNNRDLKGYIREFGTGNIVKNDPSAFELPWYVGGKGGWDIRKIGTYYAWLKVLMSGGVYKAAIYGLSATEKGGSVVKILKVLEAEAKAAGASKIVVEGLAIGEKRLIEFLPYVKRLGYTIEKTTAETIKISKKLK